MKSVQEIIEAQGSGRTFVIIKTSEGTIEVMLYDQTPVHRDNFAKLAEGGFYDGILFHRVIEDFMIQAGDPASRESLATAAYGASSAQNSIASEINDNFFHHKGALAAARQADQFNPERRSSDSQFYIISGKAESDASMDEIEEKVSREIPEDRREVYKTIGGVPSLDGEYTIFGRVVKGMDVVDKIAKVKTDYNDRPREDIYIKKTTVKRKK